jgi:hypothetical protein
MKEAAIHELDTPNLYLPNIQHTIENLWLLDSIGIRENPNINDDDVAMSLFLKNVKWDEQIKRYVIQ